MKRREEADVCACISARARPILFLNGLGRFFLEPYFREVDAGEGLHGRWHLAYEARYLAARHITAAQQDYLLRPGQRRRHLRCDLQ